MKENKNCGIYKITNITNNKIYVGSSSNLKSRKNQHFKSLRDNKHFNKHLQNSYNKYGQSNFEWTILEYIERQENKKELKGSLLEKEQYFIDKLQVCTYGYNTAPIAGSTLGIKFGPQPDEQKKKMVATRRKNDSYNHTEEWKKEQSVRSTGRVKSKEEKLKLSIANKGKKLSEEHKKKLKNRVISEEHRKAVSIANRGKKLSKEHRENISLGNMGKVHTQETRDKISKKVINLTTNIIFKSTTEAALYYKLDGSSISKVCRGKRSTAGNYKWSYAN